MNDAPKPTKLKPTSESSIEGETKMRFVRFVTKGLTLTSMNKPDDYIAARETPAKDGYDIAFVDARRAFRFDHYERGALTKRRWVHETRVDVAEDWDAPQPISAA